MKPTKVKQRSSTLGMVLSHLSDQELLRLHDPITRLECELHARLSSCIAEHDATHAACTGSTDAATLNSNLCNALAEVKKAAREVIEHWDQGHLARAVNELRQVIERN